MMNDSNSPQIETLDTTNLSEPMRRALDALLTENVAPPDVYFALKPEERVYITALARTARLTRESFAANNEPLPNPDAESGSLDRAKAVLAAVPQSISLSQKQIVEKKNWWEFWKRGSGQ